MELLKVLLGGMVTFEKGPGKSWRIRFGSSFGAFILLLTILARVPEDAWEGIKLRDFCSWHQSGSVSVEPETPAQGKPIVKSEAANMVVCLGLDDQSFYSSDSIGNRACKALGDAIITAPLGIASATFGKESLEVETFKQFPQNLDRNKELGKHEKENETQGAEYPIPSEEKGEN